MDQRMTGLILTGNDNDPKLDCAEKGEHLEDDIDKIRNNLGTLVGELDHRRHQALDLARHLRPLAIGAVTLAVVGGGLAIYRSRQPPHLRMAQRFKQALAVAAGQPLSGAKPSVAKRIAGAAGATLVSLLVRKIARRYLNA